MEGILGRKRSHIEAEPHSVHQTDAASRSSAGWKTAVAATDSPTVAGNQQAAVAVSIGMHWKLDGIDRGQPGVEVNWTVSFPIDVDLGVVKDVL